MRFIKDGDQQCAQNVNAGIRSQVLPYITEDGFRKTGQDEEAELVDALCHNLGCPGRRASYPQDTFSNEIVVVVDQGDEELSGFVEASQ